MKVTHQSNLCHSCHLATSCFNISFESPHFSHLSQIIQKSIIVKKNEAVYYQQEKFRGLFTVKQGGVKTYLVSETGQQVVTGFYLPGEILGFDAVYSEHYIANAVSLTSSEICWISFADLLKLASENQTIQRELFKLFSYRLQSNHQKFHLNSEQKVAAFLLDYASRILKQTTSENDFYLLPTQQDIASYLNLTPETVSRTLHRFIDQEIFQSSQAKRIENLNCQKLREILER
ncbi:MAG: transcriptional regulator [Gammaproteobacteria bacterium]|nr:transcriptional regulator [Gammaproteobacteria bacterium]